MNLSTARKNTPQADAMANLLLDLFKGDSEPYWYDMPGYFQYEREAFDLAAEVDAEVYITEWAWVQFPALQERGA